jgi:dolichyl-phosphate-mannose--protein O-mannosyl transferase
VTLLLGFMASAMIYSAGLENATFDESEHMYSGYTLWRNGDYAYNAEHPPVAKLLAGVPLARFDLWLPQRYIFRQTGQDFVDSQPFLYSNRANPEVLLFRARLPLIILTLLFGLVIALWTRRHFGTLAAVLALFLFALDPNVIAHGRYVNTDLAAAAFLFFAVIAWDRLLRTRRTIDLSGAGVMLGLAFATKFSLMVTPALLLILYAARWWRQQEGLGLRHLVKSMTATMVIAGCTVGLIYFPDTVTLLQRNSDHLQNQIPPEARSPAR